MSKKSKYPKPIAIRFPDEVTNRMDAVAEKMSQNLKTRIKRSNVLEMCVTAALPTLEEKYKKGQS